MNRLQRVAWWTSPMLVCLLVHWRGFVSWFQSDDFVWLGVGLNRHGWLDYVLALFAPGSEGHIRPLTERLFFLAGFSLFGMKPLPFHVIVYATEFANLALVAWIGTRLTGRRAAGFLAAMLWAVNAVTTDPLAWVSAYNEVLCVFLMLLAFHFLLRYVEHGESRFNVYQWIAFLVGFGALETNIVYPALAAAYAILFARPYLRRIWLLFLPSMAYFALHMAVAPTGKDPAYVLHFTGGMLRTLAKYWAWTVGPVGFWAPVAVPAWLVPAAVVVLSLGLLAFAATRGRLAIFCLAWFVIVIVPVLPLRDHVSEYYAFVPSVGLCWLGGWALAEVWRSGAVARAAAIALAGLYLLLMVPRTLAASDFHYRLSSRIRDLVEGVASAHQQHPNQTILLDGVDTILFYDAILDRPFRLLGIDHVYLTPGSEKRIEAHPEMGDVAEFVLPPAEVARAIDAGEAEIYDVRGPLLRNITSTYAPEPGDTSFPRRVDVASPLAAPLLGPEWYGLDGNHRWMPRRATLRIGGPSAGGQKLYLQGSYPPEQLAKGPVTVTVSVNGLTLPPQSITAGGNFSLSFPLPEALVGRTSLELAVEVSRTFRAGADIRDLGLAFGDFEVK